MWILSMGAVKTNIIGTENLLNAAKQNKLKKQFVWALIKLCIQLTQWNFEGYDGKSDDSKG